MTWDKTPWMVGDGAVHSAEVGRLIAFLATSGAEGIVDAADLKVTATSTPSGQVQMGTGAATILNKSDSRQAYGVRATAAELVAISPTGSGGSRTDMVVARIEDPQYEPWEPVEDMPNGQFIFTRVIPGVPANATTLADAGRPNDSAIPLARITVPPSTSTITDAMITDLRSVANPRQQLGSWVQKPASNVDASTSAGWQNWITLTSSTRIPSWAGRAIVRLNAAGLIALSPGWNGQVRVALVVGGVAIATQGIGVNDGFSATTRTHIPFSDSVDIPASHAGQLASIVVQTSKVSGSGNLRADASSTISVDNTYIQAPR